MACGLAAEAPATSHGVYSLHNNFSIRVTASKRGSMSVDTVVIRVLPPDSHA
jgi:hypothetical protein